VSELDLSNNPILSPEEDARASLFVRMLSDNAYARHITELNLSRIGLHEVPAVVPMFRLLTSLQLSHNRIVVYLHNFTVMSRYFQPLQFFKSLSDPLQLQCLALMQ